MGAAARIPSRRRNPSRRTLSLHGEGCAANAMEAPRHPPPFVVTSSVCKELLSQLQPTASSSETSRRTKRWPSLDDALHALLEVTQQLGGHRVDVAEVVVEATPVMNGPTPEFTSGKTSLNSLREHVRGMAQGVTRPSSRPG